MLPFDAESMTITGVRHLPIVKAYAQKIGLVETIDRRVGSQMELSPGMAVFGMVLDTLSGRTPLYRLTEFFEDKDTELLLGTTIEPERFCDTNLSRSMDQIFETGTQKIFSRIAQNALAAFAVYMARYGLEPGAYVYVADSAFVTEDNLKKADGRQTWFLTRLPATYNECGRIIRQAVAADSWIDIGPLAEERDRPRRPVARYRAYDGTVELYGKTYRAVVLHSSAHDKRRHKRIDRMLKQDRKQLEKDCKKITDSVYYCQADAKVAIDKLIRRSASSYHQLQAEVEEIPKYGRGRPAVGKPRKVSRYEYRVTATVVKAPQKVQPLREEAGCFVLLTNLLDQQSDWSAPDLLSLYKSQIGIEKNFSFLKDPAIVNSIFLKKAERIEVLGLVLLISLLIWRLMERSMRQYVETNDCELPGWVRRKTRKPTSFMMTTKFSSIMVVSTGNHRQLAKPLKPDQLEYLKALDVSVDTFTIP